MSSILNALQLDAGHNALQRYRFCSENRAPNGTGQRAEGLTILPKGVNDCAQRTTPSSPTTQSSPTQRTFANVMEPQRSNERCHDTFATHKSGARTDPKQVSVRICVSLYVRTFGPAWGWLTLESNVRLITQRSSQLSTMFITKREALNASPIANRAMNILEPC